MTKSPAEIVGLCLLNPRLAEVINAMKQGPLIIHCLHGKNRSAALGVMLTIDPQQLAVPGCSLLFAVRGGRRQAQICGIAEGASNSSSHFLHRLGAFHGHGTQKGMVFNPWKSHGSKFGGFLIQLLRIPHDELETSKWMMMTGSSPWWLPGTPPFLTLGC